MLRRQSVADDKQTFLCRICFSFAFLVAIGDPPAPILGPFEQVERPHAMRLPDSLEHMPNLPPNRQNYENQHSASQS